MWRSRYLSGAKSDRGDTEMLADLVRTDRHNHRQVVLDTDTGQGVKVLARAHQNLIWDRKRHVNELRSKLRDYYPAAVELLQTVPLRDALAVLGAAPTPREGSKMTQTRIKTVLKKAGRKRRLDQRADEILNTAYRAPQYAVHC